MISRIYCFRFKPQRFSQFLFDFFFSDEQMRVKGDKGDVICVRFDIRVYQNAVSLVMDTLMTHFYCYMLYITMC